MKQVVIDSIAHPITSLGAGGAGIAAQDVIQTGNTHVDLILKVVTFIVSVAPAILHLFKRKKKTV